MELVHEHFELCVFWQSTQDLNRRKTVLRHQFRCRTDLQNIWEGFFSSSFQQEPDDWKYGTLLKHVSVSLQLEQDSFIIRHSYKTFLSLYLSLSTFPFPVDHVSPFIVSLFVTQKRLKTIHGFWNVYWTFFSEFFQDFVLSNDVKVSHLSKLG